MANEKILIIDDSPTIIKVVELVLGKQGFKIISARDGKEGIQLAKSEKPDLILLDFVMPKMNGYQVCKVISADNELKDIPIILMSAKGNQVGERFVKVMGIVDYITKPFSPDSLLTVVTHTLSKYSDVEDLEKTEQPIPISKEELLDKAHAQQKIKKEALSKFRSTIIRSIATSLIGAENLINENISSNELIVQAKKGLTDKILETAISEYKANSPEITEKGVAFNGDLTIVPITEVFSLIYTLRESGTLTVSTASSKVEVYFKQSKIVLATASGVSEEYLLGRYIVELNLMTEEDLDEFVQSLPPDRFFLGVQLIKSGKITEEDLKKAMIMQTKELCFEIIKWDAGRFVFVPNTDLPALAEEAALELDVESVLLEGVRKVDEWHLIEKEIDNFDLIFVRNDDAIIKIGRHNLMREELTVLELINGKNSIRDIIRKSHMGSFDITKILYRLFTTKLIRKKVSAAAV